MQFQEVTIRAPPSPRDIDSCGLMMLRTDLVETFPPLSMAVDKLNKLMQTFHRTYTFCTNSIVSSPIENDSRYVFQRFSLNPLVRAGALSIVLIPSRIATDDSSDNIIITKYGMAFKFRFPDLDVDSRHVYQRYPMTLHMKEVHIRRSSSFASMVIRGEDIRDGEKQECKEIFHWDNHLNIRLNIQKNQETTIQRLFNKIASGILLHIINHAESDTDILNTIELISSQMPHLPRRSNRKTILMVLKKSLHHIMDANETKATPVDVKPIITHIMAELGVKE